MSSEVIGLQPISELCDTVTIDVVEEQDSQSLLVPPSSNTDGSSFQYGSGSTLSDARIYVMLDPGNNYQQSSSSKSLCVSDLKFKPIAGRTRTGETKCLEPGCNFICSRIPQLRIHLEEYHGIQQEKKSFAFNSEKDFKDWLCAVEREARCTYMRRRGWQSNKNGSVTGCFYCHRGGAYTSKATKKQMKLQGSCKIGVQCTSSMKVTMWYSSDDSSKFDKHSKVTYVHVEAYLQHYGHNLDLNHTRITKQEKEDIARKLSSGISRHKILDDIRGTLDTTAVPHRVHLLSLQDIYNIEKKEGIKINNYKKGNEEGTTVQAWIEKMQMSEDNPVLLIKYQQEKASATCSCLSDDDFILVLQTPLQLMMLRRYGPHQCICMDITQGDPLSSGTRNDPSFYLTTLEVIVPNEQDEVFPVAWFVSNRKDKPVIEIFLKQIKNNLSDLTLTPSYLMLPSNGVTGGCDWFDVWTSIFGSGPRKMLCGWHIMDEWKQRIQRSFIKTTTLEGTRLLANLQTVLHEAATSRFVSLLQAFTKDLAKEEATIPFLKYFKTYYIGQPEVWSRAYRTEPLIQSEARFEEYHKKVSRHIYHEGFKRKQLDVLIKTLMRHSRDKALNKLRQSYKLNSDVNIKRMTSSQHLGSSLLPTNFVSPHQDSRTWSVMSVIDSVRAVEQPSEAGQLVKLKKLAVEYIVKCTDVDQCPARLMCAYRCDDCGICSHHFVCSCQNEQKVTPAVGGGLKVLCEHCHLVVRYMRSKGQTVESLFTAPAIEAPNEVRLGEMQDQNKEHDGVNKLVVMVVEEEERDLSEENVFSGRNFLSVERVSSNGNGIITQMETIKESENEGIAMKFPSLLSNDARNRCAADDHTTVLSTDIPKSCEIVVTDNDLDHDLLSALKATSDLGRHSGDLPENEDFSIASSMQSTDRESVVEPLSKNISIDDDSLTSHIKEKFVTKLGKKTSRTSLHHKKSRVTKRTSHNSAKKGVRLKLKS